jgi:hypothetical protein
VDSLTPVGYTCTILQAPCGTLQPLGLKRQVGACIPAAAYTKPLLQIKHTNANSCLSIPTTAQRSSETQEFHGNRHKNTRAVQCRALEYAARMLRCRHHETVVWRRVPTRYRVAGGCRCVDDCGRVTPAIRLCLRCCPVPVCSRRRLGLALVSLSDIKVRKERRNRDCDL